MPTFLRRARRENWDLGDVEGERPDDQTSARDFSERGSFSDVSVWAIEAGNSNLPQILAALASVRQRLANLDYVVFDDAVLAAHSVSVKNTDGETLDEDANRRWHRELVGLTGEKALKLVHEIKQRGSAVVERVPGDDVVKYVAGSVKAGRIVLGKLAPKLKKRVEAELKSQA